MSGFSFGFVDGFDNFQSNIRYGLINNLRLSFISGCLNMFKVVKEAQKKNYIPMVEILAVLTWVVASFKLTQFLFRFSSLL